MNDNPEIRELVENLPPDQQAALAILVDASGEDLYNVLTHVITTGLDNYEKD